MPPAWPMNERVRLDLGGIPEAAAHRQAETARAILERLALRPGVVLADEVGMGKTFVALAVASSAALVSDQPAVVMVPPGLLGKWEQDVLRFRSRCMVLPDGVRPDDAFRFRRAESGAAFLACFDDPPDRRAHLVLLVNTALHRAERDPYVRLEAMRQALDRHDTGRTNVRTLARRARELLHSGAMRRLDVDQIETLLRTPTSTWRAVLRGFDIPCDDDPVPEAFLAALGSSDLSELAKALRIVPKHDSKNYRERIGDARTKLAAALKKVWRKALNAARVRSPLLVFDEAHHLKNPDTRLASLFLDPEAGDTSVISGAFDRMLFLTATPFQLGHHELLEVLRRFLAVRFDSLGGDSGLERVRGELDSLGEALDRGQTEALHLDGLWGELRAEDLPAAPSSTDPDSWWEVARTHHEQGGSLTPRLAGILEQHRRTRQAMLDAQTQLRPWVLRHLRPRMMSVGEREVFRRIEHTGRAIVNEQEGRRGLGIPENARFPFLLCARAQSIIARSRGTRAYFAEGLASSYDAFLDTSAGARPVDDELGQSDGLNGDAEVRWYLNNVNEFVRSNGVRHPKIEPTVQRAVALWQGGHKVLIFGHFIMTIRALTERLNEAVDQAVAEQAVRALAVESGDRDEAMDHVRRIVQRLQDRDSPLRRGVRERVERWIADAPELTPSQRDQVVELLLGTLATSSSVVRNLPLHRPAVRASLESERPTVAQARDAADAVSNSLSRGSGSRLSFKARTLAFVQYLTGALATSDERDAALRELLSADRRVARQATGKVERDTRRRLLLGFNSPLLPEILVASEVMSEGVDLHLDCRHVIHHDLSWNPSTLEQRTGRVDRLRCLAEREGESILVYLPYLEGTADEKMYRVVSDRARWFQVVMGEQYEVDERATDALAARVPFPADAARALSLQLSVTESDSLP